MQDRFGPDIDGVIIEASGVQTTRLPDCVGTTDFAIITSPDGAEQTASLVDDIHAGKYH